LIEYEVQHKPVFTLLKTKLRSGQSIRAEAGAMVYMKNITMETSAGGGLLSSLKRSVLGGESFFMNTFTCPTGEGEVGFAPPYAGDVMCLDLKNETWFLQGGSYLCSSPELMIDTKFQGLKGFVSREGLFFLKMSGTGQLFVSIFGAIEEHELVGDEFTIDTGHLVAFQEGIDYQVKTVGGLKSTVFSGEGLVARLSGRGRFLLQTRSTGAFVDWLIPFLPKPSSGHNMSFGGD
jgi:uncharacterized protein (TIGR00266 family)